MPRQAQTDNKTSHRLPTPQPVHGLEDGPFVGNESVDDNIAECVLVTLSAMQDPPPDVEASVAQGIVRLSGNVTEVKLKKAVVATVRALAGVRSVIDEINVITGLEDSRASAEEADAAIRHRSKPMIYITRFCSLERPSRRFRFC